jgi:hypothetical protein
MKMKLWRNCLALITVLSCAFTSLSITSASIYINPYVAAYNVQIANDEKSGISRPDNQQYSEMIYILNQYYYEDQNVASILEDLKLGEDILNKTLSLEKEDKIYIMRVICDNYKQVANASYRDRLEGFLSRYASSSGDAKSIAFYNGVISSTPQLMMTYTYNGSGAGNWGLTHGNSYNTNYPDMNNLGGDCTNFVSQCMYLGGGIPQAGDWYCSKRNSTYPSPINSYQLNYSWSLSSPSPWVSVSEWKQYWNSCTFYDFTKADYIANHDAIYNMDIYIGDCVIFYTQFLWIQTPKHLMIISSYDYANHDFLLAGHSNERTAYPLLTAIGAYSMISFVCP